MAKNLAKTTTDHDTIRRWAEERGGSPAEVTSTAREDQTGIIRIDLPGSSGEGTLRRIGWDEWFEKFEASGLALVYEDETSPGQRSSFNKLVARETAAARSQGARTSRGGSRARRAGARAGTSSGASGRARPGARKTPARKPSRGTSRTTQRTGARTTRRSTDRRQASRTSAARSTGRTAKRGGTGRKGGGSRSRKSRAR